MLYLNTLSLLASSPRSAPRHHPGFLAPVVPLTVLDADGGKCLVESRSAPLLIEPRTGDTGGLVGLLRLGSFRGSCGPTP